ncbi:metallophosphoesterase [Actinocrispum wychmicini]|uniref:Calcineurin-like phosphoesterase family protein n=1 Tax=Actinocrispum wychmicini TaxID=1213861 RepID=A0A4R2JD90_9PSEU|nr:metallophosphoesterase [Actinocrispum wychmicini]TCO56884.1 calcineurin-like phosphoesterase family protein [Actinocrispum wychmicini]
MTPGDLPAQTRRIVVISDTQIPYEHRPAVTALIRFIGDYQPDEVVHIGDLMDYPQPSRWSKGSAAEYEGSVFADSDYAKKNFLQPLRDAYSGSVGVIEGNHDLRPRTYLAKYAPALAESGAFTLPSLLDFDGFGIRLLPDFYDVASGWVMTHGHLGKIALSQVAGNTALGAAKKFGRSVIMGHTHRLGIGHHTTGYDGKVSRTLTGFEVGHLMDTRKAGYLNGATANWQMGFGIVHATSNHVQVDAIAISNRFAVDGQIYPLRTKPGGTHRRDAA